jgi:hypothetical protein
MASETFALRARIALVSAAVAALAPFAVAYLADRTLAAELDRAARTRVADAARHSANVVSRYLVERRRDTETLAALPDIVHATRIAAQVAQRRRLVGRPIARLERDMDSTRALGGDPQLRRFLAATRDAFDFAEVFFTERDGFTVLGTDRTPDFVQSDEEWWQRAFANGFDESAPLIDPSGAVAIELAARIADPSTRAPMGVLRVALRLRHLNELVAAETPTPITVEVVDSERRIVLSPERTRLLRQLPDSVALDKESVTVVGDVVAVVAAREGRWWVVARSPAPGRVVTPRRPLYWAAGGSAALVFLVVLAALALARPSTPER